MTPTAAQPKVVAYDPASDRGEGGAHGVPAHDARVRRAESEADRRRPARRLREPDPLRRARRAGARHRPRRTAPGLRATAAVVGRPGARRRRRDREGGALPQSPRRAAAGTASGGSRTVAPPRLVAAAGRTGAGRTCADRSGRDRRCRRRAGRAPRRPTTPSWASRPRLCRRDSPRASAPRWRCR